MKLKHQIPVVVAIALLLLLLITGTAVAQSEALPSKPQELPTPSPYTNSFWDKLDRVREDRQLQDLIEQDLDKSITIRAQIQTEVDRAFSHTTTLLNVLLGVLTFLPILAAVSVWFIRRSVINQIVGETRRQIQAEVEKQLEQEVAAEIKEQTEAFKQEIETLRKDFLEQLSQLKSLFVDAQKEKDQIVQELAQITPSPIRESAPPEAQAKIHALTKQLELLSANPQLSFTANDYVEQGKALYFEGRYDDAIALYKKAIQQEPENPKAWFGKGAALAKLQQLEVAIAAYEKATELKPDFFLAWFGIARCYALQGNAEFMLASLQQAINLNPEKSREVIKTDPSFAAMRENAAFQKLIEA